MLKFSAELKPTVQFTYYLVPIPSHLGHRVKRGEARSTCSLHLSVKRVVIFRHEKLSLIV